MFFTLEAKLIAGLALLAALWAGFEWKLHEARQEGAKACEDAHQAAAAAEERRRTAAIAEVANEAQRQSNRARADADTARASLGRLLERARGDGIRPPAAAASAPAGSAADLSADVLGGLGEAARQLAQAADEARNAGTACERAYDSLK